MSLFQYDAFTYWMISGSLGSTVITCSGRSSPQGVSVGCAAFVWVRQSVLMPLCVGRRGWVRLYLYFIGVCVFEKCVCVCWGAVCAVTFSVGHKNHNIQTLWLFCPAQTMWEWCVGDKWERERDGKRKEDTDWSFSYEHISLRLSCSGKRNNTTVNTHFKPVKSLLTTEKWQN